MVRSLGEMGVDRVLADGRKDLIATATRRAQAGLDAAHSGLELSSLELTRLAPPAALAARLRRGAERLHRRGNEAEGSAGVRRDASFRRRRPTPTRRCRPRAAPPTPISRPREGEAGAFLALDREYRANPVVVRERLYRDAVERAIGAAGNVRWVPPPVGGRYNGFRITVAGIGTAGLAPPSAHPTTAPMARATTIRIDGAASIDVR